LAGAGLVERVREGFQIPVTGYGDLSLGCFDGTLITRL
jgi:hypothetical protein